jgi:hypothetical protein
MLIDNQIINWKLDNDSSKVIAITDKLTSFSSRIDFNDYVEWLFGSDKQMAYMTANYKDSICKIIDNSEFKELFQRFANNYKKEQQFENRQFVLSNHVILIDYTWIEQLFNRSKTVNYKKSWNKFYKKYPYSPGYFELSKIEYSNNFGLVYMVHRAKPLIGYGKIDNFKKG